MPTKSRLALAAIAGLTAALALPRATSAQIPLSTYADGFDARFDRSQPVVRYIVRAAPATDSTGYSVELQLRSVSDTVRLASPIWAPGAYRVANFYRFVKNVRVSDGGTVVPVTREDSSTWRAIIRSGNATVRYDVRYPDAAAAAGLGNYSFLRPDGALMSGPMTYLYVVGQKLAPVHVTFELPASWRIATGLSPTFDPRTFFAPSYDILVDSPVLTGPNLHIWPFDVAGVPHRVAYYTQKDAPAIDSTKWVDMHRRIVMAARDIMGRLPYREYTFIYEDGPGGGLEHLNSATMSAPARALALNPDTTSGLTAHEYFHAWNVKRIRPVELGPFAYEREVHTTGLWWAEGVTDYFSDEINRRTSLLSPNAARNALASSITSYLANPGHDKVSPERSSWTAWNANTVNGGYNISYYTTGGLIGQMLELYIRDATNGARGMDDIEGYLFDHYAGVTGYTDQNLLHAINTICGCDMNLFYTRFVAGHETFDFDAYLKYAGWKTVMTRVTTDSLGHPLADVRGGITQFAGVGSLGSYVGSPPRLSLSVPNGSFGKAGLVDGDYISAVNGKQIRTVEDFRAALAEARVGASYTVAYLRNGKPMTTTVTILPYETVRVDIVDLPNITAQQRRMRDIWLRGGRDVTVQPATR
ncbi:MAG: PDZ domain-containing protein [Gemmatimonadaceae bacterium]